MNTFLLLLIGIPIVEIYLFIKLGSQIGAFNTILLIFITAFFGIIYARYEKVKRIPLDFICSIALVLSLLYP